MDTDGHSGDNAKYRLTDGRNSTDSDLDYAVLNKESKQRISDPQSAPNEDERYLHEVTERRNVIRWAMLEPNCGPVSTSDRWNRSIFPSRLSEKCKHRTTDGVMSTSVGHWSNCSRGVFNGLHKYRRISCNTVTRKRLSSNISYII